jgi:NADH dehydrogenase
MDVPRPVPSPDPAQRRPCPRERAGRETGAEQVAAYETAVDQAPRPPCRHTQVVIIGGGFAGVDAARNLRKVDVDVILLDRGTTHVFSPLLYQCATGLLSEGDIAMPLRHMFRRQKNVDVQLGEAVDIDMDERTITVMRFDRSTYRMPFDYLIFGGGMRQSYHGRDDFSPFAPGMKTLDDALAIRRRLIAAFDIAESLPTHEERRPWLTFAISGGGPTGVELAGQIRELATLSLESEYRSINPAEARVLLFHGGTRVLNTFSKRASRRATAALEKLGVEIALGVHVTAVDETGVETTRKTDKVVTRYDARTVLWTAGVEAVPFAAKLAAVLGVKQGGGGRIPVDEYLRALTGDNTPADRVWVAGDVMATPKPLPGVAEVAMQSGRYIGAAVARQIEGKSPAAHPFRYLDMGSAAYIAQGQAVLQSGPFTISGVPGWLAWGAIHIGFLAGFTARGGTMVSWLIALASRVRRERAITFGDPQTARLPYRQQRDPEQDPG